MRKTAVAIGLLLLPLTVLALDYNDVSMQYKDAKRFSVADRAGITVLTHLGAVAGYPDGTFGAGRDVNRAEFLKIVLLSHPSMTVTAEDAADCFPDVRRSDWFSRYVCKGKTLGMLGGYPDGMFHPERNVNYVEAVKLLTTMYAPTAEWKASNPWYAVYMGAARVQSTLLREDVSYNAFLTRGQVARLAAAARAYHDGELTQYHALEWGEVTSVASSRSSVSMASSDGTSATSSSTSFSASSSTSAPASSNGSTASSVSSSSFFPSVSRFVVLGQQSQPLFDGTFTSLGEDAAIRFVDVTLRREVVGLSSLALVDGAGTTIATLVLATDNNTDHRKWTAAIGAEGATVLKKDTPTNLGIVATMKPRADGGGANQVVDLETFSIFTVGVVSSTSKNLVAANPHNPLHQTAAGRVTAVRNGGSGSVTLTAGKNRMIANIAISGIAAAGATISADSVDFLAQLNNVQMSNVRIGGPTDVVQTGCGADTSIVGRFVCATLPEGYRIIGANPLVLRVYADITVTNVSKPASLQLLFSGRGSFGKDGAVHWSDGTGRYNWIDADATMEQGTMWNVLP